MVQCGCEGWCRDRPRNLSWSWDRGWHTGSHLPSNNEELQKAADMSCFRGCELSKHKGERQ